MSMSNTSETALLNLLFKNQAWANIGDASGLQPSAASGAGTAALLLVRPLAQIPLSIASLMTEKEFWNQLPSAPQIRDGACLGFILGTGAAVAAATTFAGATEVVYG